ncbi:MAG: hypothetical protein AVDCRST_MAG49-4732, partial [uncultured Thermomicrobiales bacterium]
CVIPCRSGPDGEAECGRHGGHSGWRGATPWARWPGADRPRIPHRGCR